jgi:putative hydrolase of the HAD superfamily
MNKKAIILDLDNTIYSVSTIGTELFSSLFTLIESSNEFSGDISSIKTEIMRRPFQVVASAYGFSENLTKQGIDLLHNLSYEGTIQPFPDYYELKGLAVDKYLVTTGFLKLQQSKIKGMKLDQDFREIHIVDPATSEKTKKDVFADIIGRNGYSNSEVLVVGDDPHSEIKAARDLGIEGILYDKFNLYADTDSIEKINDFKQLAKRFI